MALRAIPAEDTRAQQSFGTLLRWGRGDAVISPKLVGQASRTAYEAGLEYEGRYRKAVDENRHVE